MKTEAVPPVSVEQIAEIRAAIASGDASKEEALLIMECLPRLLDEVEAARRKWVLIVFDRPDPIQAKILWQRSPDGLRRAHQLAADLLEAFGPKVFVRVEESPVDGATRFAPSSECSDDEWERITQYVSRYVSRQFGSEPLRET